MELRKYKLGDICKNITDGEHGTVVDSLDGKYFLLSNKNIVDGKIVINATKDRRIDKQTFDKINKRTKLEKDDVLISTVGTLGKLCIVEPNFNYTIQRSIGVIKPNQEKLNSNFLKYLLMTNTYQNLLQKTSKGAVQKCIFIDDLKNLNVSIPPLESQQKIAAVLSTLDDKIALNRRINAKLEQMAKRLYDHWFVQFDFPNADGKPYKASGGKMVWNETFKREIPEGWEVKSVNDISTSYRGVGYTADDEKSAEDNDVVLILRGNNISNNHIIYDGNTVYLDKSFVSEEQKIHKYDFVMTMSSGSKEHVGKSAMFLFDSPHSYGAFCNKITPAKNCQFFLENYLHSEYFKKYIQITCSGTGINNLTNEHFDKAFFSFPDNEVLESFNQKINPIYEQIGVLEKENLRLMGLRDKLLPLLMNGQVEVN